MGEIPTDAFLDRVLGPGRDRAEAEAKACPGCGSRCDTGWAYCEVCGIALPVGQRATELPRREGAAQKAGDVVDRRGARAGSLAAHRGIGSGVASSPTAEALAPPRRSRRVRIAVGMLIASLAGAALTGWIQYDHAQGRFIESRHQLSETKGLLISADEQLGLTRDELATDKSALASAEAELSRTKQDLVKSQGSLDNAKDRLNLQASQIDTLQTCLRGVSEALSDVAYGDYEGAVSALDAVRTSCRKASNIL